MTSPRELTRRCTERVKAWIAECDIEQDYLDYERAGICDRVPLTRGHHASATPARTRSLIPADSRRRYSPDAYVPPSTHRMLRGRPGGLAERAKRFESTAWTGLETQRLRRFGAGFRAQHGHRA